MQDVGSFSQYPSSRCAPPVKGSEGNREQKPQKEQLKRGGWFDGTVQPSAVCFTELNMGSILAFHDQKSLDLEKHK